MIQTIAARKPVMITAAQTPFINRNIFHKMLGENHLDPGITWREADEASRIVDVGRSLKKVKDILHKCGRQQDVEECEEGFRIGGELANKLRVDYFADEATRDRARLTMIADLKRLGYRVAMLAMDPAEYELRNTGFNAEAVGNGLEPQDMILMKKKQDGQGEFSLSFPRDLFVQLGRTVYVNPGAECFDWGPFFNWAGENIDRESSRIGFGGEVVIADRFAFLSESYAPDISSLSPNEQEKAMTYLQLLEMLSIGETELTLRKLGRKVYRVPCGWADLLPPGILAGLGTKKRFLIPADHADMNLMHLPTENAVLVKEPYYRDNKTLLDRIMEEIKPDLFAILPDEDGMPVNLLPLPYGGVYLDQVSANSINILRQAGIKVETTSRPFGTWAWGGQGGIHCSTNTVWL